MTLFRFQAIGEKTEDETGMDKNNIILYLEKNKIIPEEHHRTRANHNSLTAQVSLDKNLMESKDQNKHTIILIPYCKAPQRWFPPQKYEITQ